MEQSTDSSPLSLKKSFFTSKNELSRLSELSFFIRDNARLVLSPLATVRTVYGAIKVVFITFRHKSVYFILLYYSS